MRARVRASLGRHRTLHCACLSIPSQAKGQASRKLSPYFIWQDTGTITGQDSTGQDTKAQRRNASRVLPAGSLARGSEFHVWKPHNGSCVPGSPDKHNAPLLRGCKRVCTSHCRELVHVQQRRLPLWLSEKECMCLSKQNFPVYGGKQVSPAARKEQGQRRERERNSSTLPKSRCPGHLALSHWPLSSGEACFPRLPSPSTSVGPSSQHGKVNQTALRVAGAQHVGSSRS